MSNVMRIDRRIWWLTMPKAADKSSNISIEYSEAVLVRTVSRMSTFDARLFTVHEDDLCKNDRDLAKK